MLAATLLGGGLAACVPARDSGGPAPPLTFLALAIIDPEPAVPGDPNIGGLSSLFPVGGDLYYAISDDRGAAGPARFYLMAIHLADGSSGLADAGVDAAGDSGADGSSVTFDASIVGWQELFDADGESLVARTFDLEGLVAIDRNLFIASEGDVSAGIEPFVAVFGPQRRMMERLGLPSAYVPNADRSSGVRNNMAFESLAVTPDARYLFTATESALTQDGPIPTPEAGTTARILRFDRDHGVFDAQFAYPVDAVHARSPIGGLEANGVAELLALSADHLLVLERSFVAGVIPLHSIKLFEVCLGDATDISGIDSLSTVSSVVPARKRLVTDLALLVPGIDNVEGMSFGPPLGSGAQTMLFVSDNNFAPDRQTTQVLAFRLDPAAIRGCAPEQQQ